MHVRVLPYITKLIHAKSHFYKPIWPHVTPSSQKVALKAKDQEKERKREDKLGIIIQRARRNNDKIILNYKNKSA